MTDILHQLKQLSIGIVHAVSSLGVSVLPLQGLLWPCERPDNGHRER